MDLISSILRSDWFAIVAIIWGITAIAFRDNRENLLKRVFDIITKPIIFQTDSNAESVPPYARRLLESVARVMTSELLKVTRRLVAVGGDWRSNLAERFSKDDSSFWQMLGSVVLLFLMIAFLYADLVAIFNTLDEIGMIVTVPSIFRNYEYAVTLGSFFTIVLAGLLLIEIFGRPIFTDIAKQPRAARVLLTWVSVILVISGLSVAISLGLIRFGAISNFITSGSLDSFNNLVVTVLVPANTILSTFLIVSEGLKGIPIIVMLIAQIGIVAAITVLFVFSIINYPVWFAFDIFYRVILICLYLLFYYILTPLDKITSWRPLAGEEETER